MDRIEKLLFLFGIGAFALLMLSFGQPLAGEVYLPVVAVWVVGGIAFVWWFDRHMRRAANITELPQRRRRRKR